MNNFAKLFNVVDDPRGNEHQLLITKEWDDEDEMYQLFFRFESNSGVTCMPGFSWKEESKRDEFFNEIDAEKAQAIFTENFYGVLNMASEM